MRVLFLSAFPPCPKTAGQDQSLRVINDFVARGWQLDLVYASYPGHLPELPSSVTVLKTISPSLSHCLRTFRFHPFFTRRFDRRILRYIQSIKDSYDLLYFDFSQIHLYARFIQHPWKVCMCHDVISQKFGRKWFKLQNRWIEWSERKSLACMDSIFTVSKKDSEIVRSCYGLSSVPVHIYLKQKESLRLVDSIPRQFCFYGAWNRPENLEGLVYFKERVLPLLHVMCHYIIIGGGMDEQTKKVFEVDSRFQVLGFVDDPLNEIAKSQALIVPLFQGAGVKVKVLDALTMGTPIIGTEIAFEGIEDNIEHPLFYHAESPEQFARTLNEWHLVGLDTKQKGAEEFFRRYRGNHVVDFCMERIRNGNSSNNS